MLMMSGILGIAGAVLLLTIKSITLIYMLLYDQSQTTLKVDKCSSRSQLGL